jgi:AraC family transcriptional activator of tynA and feaB
LGYVVKSGKSAEPPPGSSDAIRHWSTADVAPESRLDYFAAALSDAIIPMSVDNADGRTFHAELSLARFGEMEVCIQVGSPHQSFRGPSEFARTRDRHFNFVMTKDCPWNVAHCGRETLLAGDILCHDSQQPYQGEIHHHFTAVSVSVTEPWLRRWLPDPTILVGRISANSSWGSALSAYLSALSPNLISSPILPTTVLTDQLGGLLALVANGRRCGNDASIRPAVRSLKVRLLDCIAERCTDSRLTAADVASSINVSSRTLHRTLASAQLTFGDCLVAARVAVARRMLTSSLFKRVTTAEIGRRAGFTNASHFARVILRHTGLAPQQLRNGRQR